MVKISNPNAILNGYDIEFPTKGFIKTYYNISLSNLDDVKLGCPSFLSKSKSGTPFSQIPNLVGFDVPVKVKTQSFDVRGTIAILGQDALRDPYDNYLNGINTNKYIVVGLPYAIAFDNNYKQVSVYHNLIKDILDSGYDVYLTDIWKSWDKNNDSRLGNWITNNPHKECLGDEFSGDVQIDFIVLMGGIAQKKFKSVIHSESIIEVPVPHLSPMANGKWGELVGKPVTEDKKIKYVKDELKKKGVHIL